MTDTKSDDAPPATPMPPVLHGARLLLRGYREGDLADFYAIHSDPKVMRYWSFPAWTDISQAGEYFTKAREGNDPDSKLSWAIARREDDRVIGGVTLFSIFRAQDRAEIGYSLASAHWGRGYAREALALVLAHAFDALQLRRIEADIDPRNAASRKLVEHFGFVQEGLLRARWHVAGEDCDSAIYGLLAADWRRRAEG